MNSRGAVLLELTLVSVLLLIFLGGVASIGLPTQDILAAEKAAHYAARSAAAQWSTYPSMCSESEVVLACSSVALGVDFSVSPALAHAAKFGCDHLESAGYNPADWTLRASISGPSCEESYCASFVRVSAETTKSQQYFGLFGLEMTPQGIHSSFVVEGGC